MILSICKYPLRLPRLVFLSFLTVHSLQRFSDDWQRQRRDKEAARRSELSELRLKLIKDGTLSDEAIEALKRVFSRYTVPPSTPRTISPSSSIPYTAAARLWYRANLKLSELDEMLAESEKTEVSFADVLEFVGALAREDEDFYQQTKLNIDEKRFSFQVGDKVELSRFTNSAYHNSSAGPLAPGDRGVVLELQDASTAESRSVKVYFNGRRGLYHPQTLLSERSGLIESPGVWFLSHLFRTHGVDPSTFESIAGKQVDPTTFSYGDMVVPRTVSTRSRHTKTGFGRIVPDPSPGNTLSLVPNTVLVEFCSPSFGSAVGVAPTRSSIVQRRVELSKLCHTGWQDEDEGDGPISGDGAVDGASLEKRLKSELNGLGRLNRVSMENVLKESRKSHSSLAGLFASGLPDAINSALDTVQKQLDLPEPREDLADRIDSLGFLVQYIAARLFDPEKIQSEAPNDTDMSEANINEDPYRRLTLSNRRIISLIRERRGLPRRNMRDPSLLASGRNLTSEGPAFRTGEDPDESQASASESDLSFFDRVIRGRSVAKCLELSGVLSYVSIFSSIVTNGFLNNSQSWVRSNLAGQSRHSGLTSPSSTIDSKLVDYEDTKVTLLRTAVSLGCSPSIIRILVNHGCSVTQEDIQKAAETDQPSLLGELLQHVEWRDDILEPELYSESVKKAFERYRDHQKELASKMAQTASSFMASVLRKFVQLCSFSLSVFASKQKQSRDTLSEIVIGNPMLQVLEGLKEQKQQTSTGSSRNDSLADQPVLAPTKAVNSGLDPNGLLGLLPGDVVAESLILDPNGMIDIFDLAERLLYCKDMQNISSGIKMLTTVISSFPCVLDRDEFERYGFRELAGFHCCLANRRRLKICTNGEMKKYLISDERAPAVHCPRKHVASLHITQHASFRCDMCGCGVQRGCPMHGCRQCDWDACQTCTDETEGGLLKCHMIDTLAHEFLILSQKGGKKKAKKKALSASGFDIEFISKSLRNRDLSAVKTLLEALAKPGGLSTHEFSVHILPAFHSAMLLDGGNDSLGGGEIRNRRQLKKAKLDQEELGSFTEEGKEFAENVCVLLASMQESLSKPGSEVRTDRNADQPEGSPQVAEADGAKLLECVGSSELLRRLQLVLSLNEGMTLEPQVPRQLFKSPDDGSELHLLTKTLNLELQNSSQGSSPLKYRLRVEPLVPIREIEKLILENVKLMNDSYNEYCRGLVDDSAVILERATGDVLWNLAKVLSYDLLHGSHEVQYADVPEDVISIDLDDESSVSTLKFKTERVRLHLATREFVVIARNEDSKPRTRSRGETEAKGTPAHRARVPRHILRRTWSALSVIDSLNPVNLPKGEESRCSNTFPEKGYALHVPCLRRDGGSCAVVATKQMEKPPEITIHFVDSDNRRVPVDDKYSTTLVALLTKTKGLFEGLECLTSEDTVKMCFVMEYEPIQSDNMKVSSCTRDTKTVESQLDKSRKLRERAWSSDCMDESESDLDVEYEMNSISAQSMEVINALVEASEDNTLPRDNDYFSRGHICNYNLSQRLLECLDEPLSVVGGVIPSWCISGPCFAPRIFSYKARQSLLEKSAYGVSRSVLRQQESKINVSRLRQRMAALRARAVELVSEAFSGGAEDPTALQLQADELYGMEEALGARVKAEFRKAGWQEYSLEVVKAVVRRDHLIQDSSAVMNEYSARDTLSRRRLEARFMGESGFDAASGDEAGVTRGFYADVAEALLSTENVAGVHCGLQCNISSDVPVDVLSKIQPIDIDLTTEEDMKLPMFIPDMDATAQVVIPTPRADKKSAPGIFPRPLPGYHPQMKSVLDRYRFIGRLFAAAMRDNFLFPLPLSSSFLKLVCSLQDLDSPKESGDLLLSLQDLPRPGFLGGEVYAAAVHICRALDEIDSIQPPLSRREVTARYEEISNDLSFAKSALGKSYECSFAQYFGGRTFVDPLDPTQGEDAMPLCRGGHKKEVNIYNIREWVRLSKRFILHDGVIQQALAFRAGVNDFFPAKYLSLFTPEELQRDVCGHGDSVDTWDEKAVRKLFKLDGGKGAAEALVAVAAIGGEGGAALSRRFAPGSPTINNLVKALLEASPNQRRQFLSFVTSVPIVTPGVIEVVPIVSPSGEFLPMHDPGCLPRANTCARRLYLPRFENYESFSQVLWAVVREESRFKGFFEWRGS